jgi:hypothetical protein
MDYYGGLSPNDETHLAKGFHTVYKKKKGGLRFADLLDEVSRIDPEMRIRFTSPHPKDFPDEVNKNEVHDLRLFFKKTLFPESASFYKCLI